MVWKPRSPRFCCPSKPMWSLPGHNGSLQLSAKTRSQNSGYFIPFLPARKHKDFWPKTQPPSPGESQATKLEDHLLLVLWLLHFWLCCSSSSGRCIEAGSSRIPSCWGQQQPLSSQGAESLKVMLSLPPGYYSKATECYYGRNAFWGFCCLQGDKMGSDTSHQRRAGGTRSLVGRYNPESEPCASPKRQELRHHRVSCIC